MSDETWLVLRCQHCQQCSGHRFQKGRCPHCGQAIQRDTPVVKQVATSAELHVEVAIANTPEPLQDELRTRMLRERNAVRGEPPSAKQVLQALRNQADADGSIHRIQVETLLRKKGIDLHVDAVMEQAENEGLVLRLGEEQWLFLE